MKARNRFKASVIATAMVLAFSATGASAAVTISNQSTLNVTRTTFTLQADATNSTGAAESAFFEYGTTAAYGATTATQTNAILGNFTTRISSGLIAGQTCGTPIHFRLSTVSGTHGSDTTFATSPCLTTLNVGRTSGSDPSAAGASLTFTAVVSGATNPAGVVRFRAGGVNIAGCTAQPISGASAVCTTTTLNTNGLPTDITATYYGDTNNLDSTSSPLSQTVGPVGATAPDTPVAPNATARNAQAIVAITAPDSNGSPITGYTVTSSPAGGVDSNANSTGTQHTITGLTNGVAYTFTVVATNAAGSSSASPASNSVTPSASIPGDGLLTEITIATPGVTLESKALDMSQPPGPALMATIVGMLNTALNINTLVFESQSSTGTILLSGYGGGKLAFRTFGFNTGDTRANGVYNSGNGKFEVVSNGTKLTISPAIVNIGQLAQQFPGVKANLNNNGVITADLYGQTYVVQPSIAVRALSPANTTARMLLGADLQQHFIDSENHDQVLHPAFKDPETLRRILKQIDPKATLFIQLDGTGEALVDGRNYTLVPESVLTAVPINRIGQLWWQDTENTYRFIDLTTGLAQSLTRK